jgi:peptide subunit release factor 1 (eRF1)
VQGSLAVAQGFLAGSASSLARVTESLARVTESLARVTESLARVTESFARAALKTAVKNYLEFIFSSILIDRRSVSFGFQTGRRVFNSRDSC